MKTFGYFKAFFLTCVIFIVSGSMVWGAAGDILWTFETGKEISPSPAIGSDGTIYFGSDNENLYALSPDGNMKWRYSTENTSGLDHKLVYPPTIGNDGTIYFGANYSHLYALSPDGNLKWRYRVNGGIHYSSSAIDINNNIYFGSYDFGFYALNPDGTLSWDYFMNFGVSDGVWDSSPSIGSDGTIYVGSHDDYFYAFNNNGTLKWRYLTGNDINSSPAIDKNGNIYVGSNDTYFYSFKSDGTLNWKFKTGGSIYSSPVIDKNGIIYICSVDSLYAFNSTGILVWVKGLTFSRLSAPLIGADGTIYIFSGDTLFAINPDGTVKWQYNSNFGGIRNPTINDNGIIYAGSDWGTFYAIDTGTNAGLADSPWPKFQKDIRNSGNIETGELQTYLYLTSPNGGETWVVGTTKNITWTSNNVDKVKIYYSIYNGSIWELIAEQVDAGAGFYSWPVPATPSNNCMIRITSEEDSSEADASWDASINDVSNDVFSIQDTLLIPDYAILFSTNRDGNREIYMMDADGSNPVNLTNNTGNDRYPDWSPDGSKIVFSSDRDGNFEVYIMDKDGLNQTRLTNTPENELRYPVFSPDGSKIVFSLNKDGDEEIYMMNSDGSNQTRLTNYPGRDAAPSWSPDGSQILFESNKYGNLEICIMNADGSNVKQITFTDWDNWEPHFSPDGSKIVFGSNREGTENREIYVMDANGSNTTRLTFSPENSWAFSPRWTADGSQIVFETCVGTSSEYSSKISIMNADGSNLLDLTDLSTDDYDPEVSPVEITAEVTLLSPNGGEEWVVGTTQNITWKNGNVSNVKLEYSTNNGSSWTTIISNTSATTGSYSWTVPDSLSTNCLVKISDVTDPGIADQSNAVFSIKQTTIPPYHYQLDVSNTGNNATILITTSSIPTINDEPIVTGDCIGVFTPRGQCAGAGIWEGENLPITVWGDDSDEPDVLGFQTDESLLFKIWDSSEQAQCNAMAIYSQGEGTYATDKIFVLSSLYGSSNESIIHLESGWNMISSNMISDVPYMEAVFVDIVGNVIIVKNGEGQVFWPVFMINQIGDWKITDGYKVKLKTACDLRITGQYVQPDEITYDLAMGWNLISFIAPDGMSPANAFSQIVGDIIIVKNGAGEVYWPSYGIDQINALHIGEGYKIKLSSAVTFSYPSSVSKISVASASAADPGHFIPVLNTGYNATIAVTTYTTLLLGETPIAIGDEIGVFSPGEFCVGAVVWEGKNTAITVWGDDPDTVETIEGIQAGEEYLFKIWHKAKDIEYNSIATYSTGSSIYVLDAIVVLESLIGKEIPSSVEDLHTPNKFILSQNSPNPFNSTTTIEFAIPVGKSEHVRLNIYDLRGALVRTLVNEISSPGVHSALWDGTDETGNKVSSGIYIYRLQAGKFTKSNKMLLVK